MGVPDQDIAGVRRPSGGLPVWVTSQRRAVGPLGEKWTGRPFQAVQGRKPCEAVPVKTVRL